MSINGNKNEVQTVWREFKETAGDLTRDIASLTVRPAKQFYAHVRSGYDGSEPPISPLKAAWETAIMELAKSSGGAVGITHSVGAALVSMAVANVLTNTLAARFFLLDKNEPILPRHTARLKARAEAYQPPSVS